MPQAQDPGFLQASPVDQHAYMIQTDPDFAKASPEDQKAYLDHATGGAYSREFRANQPSMLERAGTFARTHGAGTGKTFSQMGADAVTEGKRIGSAALMMPGVAEAGMTAAGIESLPGAAALGKIVPGSVSKFAAQHPNITKFAASGAIDAARHIPYVGKMIPPYAELYPFFMGGGSKVAAAGDEALAATKDAVSKRLASWVPTSGPRSMGAKAAAEAGEGAAAGAESKIMRSGSGESNLMPEPRKAEVTKPGTAFSLTKEEVASRLKDGTLTPEQFKIAQARGLTPQGTVLVPNEAQIETEGPRSRQTFSGRGPGAASVHEPLAVGGGTAGREVMRPSPYRTGDAMPINTYIAKPTPFTPSGPPMGPQARIGDFSDINTYLNPETRAAGAEGEELERSVRASRAKTADELEEKGRQ